MSPKTELDAEADRMLHQGTTGQVRAILLLVKAVLLLAPKA